MNPRRRALLLCAAGACIVDLAAGCAGGGAPRGARNEADARADFFSLDGRIAVRYGEESLAGKVAWIHSAQRDEINLASPLGNVLAQIVRDAGGVSLIDDRRQEFRAPDVETLTERQLGWRFPLAGMTEWVRARAAAGEVRRDEAGRLLHLRDAGWEIEFSYEDDAAPLPRRLIMVYARAAQRLEIRLVIDAWAP